MLYVKSGSNRHYYIHETDLVVITFLMKETGTAIVMSKDAAFAEAIQQSCTRTEYPAMLWWETAMRDCCKQIKQIEFDAIVDYEKSFGELEITMSAMDLLKFGGKAIPVQLWGMGEGGKEYRTVVIPKDQPVTPDKIWYYGQNDFQEPLYPCRSLMVGDVMVGYNVDGLPVYYKIESQGFTRYSEQPALV